MKLSKETLEILTNFSTINDGIVFKKGNSLKTVATNKNLFACATVAETFSKEFGIYKLQNLLAVLSSYDSPEITLNEKNLTVSEGAASTTYWYTDPSMIVSPPEKNMTLPTKDVEFKLPKATLQKLLKLADVVQSPYISIENAGKGLFLGTLDIKDSSANLNRIELDVKHDKPFRMFMRREFFKVIVDDYNVTISSKGLAHFSSTNQKLEYFVATEKDSTYNK